MEKPSEDSKTRSGYMDNLWVLLQSKEFVWSKRFENLGILPRIYGSCGHYIAVEKVNITRQLVSSMIHSAKPIVTPVANIVSIVLFFYISKVGTNNMWENNDPYRPWLWVGRVDQYFLWRINLTHHVNSRPSYPFYFIEI